MVVINVKGSLCVTCRHWHGFGWAASEGMCACRESAEYGKGVAVRDGCEAWESLMRVSKTKNLDRDEGRVTA